MPEWVVYYLVGTLAIGVLAEVVAAGLVLVLAGRGTAAGLRRITGQHPADSSVLTPCTSPDCRSLPTVHHVTGAGLRCAECGHIVASV